MSHPLIASADALGLTIAPEWEEAVLFHLQLLLRIGGDVATAVAERLPDAIEPLPIDRLDTP